MEFTYRGKEYNIEKLEDFIDFLDNKSPSEDFLDSLPMPEELFDYYVNQYLELDI